MFLFHLILNIKIKSCKLHLTDDAVNIKGRLLGNMSVWCLEVDYSPWTKLCPEI